MKKFFLIIVALLFISCDHRGEKVQIERGNTAVNVEKLFTVDGITVYRFWDGCDKVYFTNRTSNVRAIESNGDNEVTIQTICLDQEEKPQK